MSKRGKRPRNRGKRLRGKKPSQTRITGYYFGYIRNGHPKGMEGEIEQALVSNPVVIEWYAKNGTVWFNGQPGPQMRRAKDDVLAALGTYGKQLSDDEYRASCGDCNGMAVHIPWNGYFYGARRPCPECDGTGRNDD